MKTRMVLKKENFLLKKLLRKLSDKKTTHKHRTLMNWFLSQAAECHEIVFPNQLTERERSCLLLAAKGMTSNETAELLGIRPSTVETYRKKIKSKLACNTMAQAVFEGISFELAKKKTANE